MGGGRQGAEGKSSVGGDKGWLVTVASLFYLVALYCSSTVVVVQSHSFSL